VRSDQEVVHSLTWYLIIAIMIFVNFKFPSSNHRISIGGLVVKLAVAITVSASPGFDSRPMHPSFMRSFNNIFSSEKHSPEVLTLFKLVAVIL
jgi:hypothetical protein